MNTNDIWMSQLLAGFVCLITCLSDKQAIDPFKHSKCITIHQKRN